MKILILDDEQIYYHYLKNKFKNCVVEYESNPLTWLDKIDAEKINLNEYSYIFCDYNFGNLSMNCFELNISKYIRKHGFQNYLILYSNLPFSDTDIENIKNTQYFDSILDKKSSKNLINIENMCSNSLLRQSWKKRMDP